MKTLKIKTSENSELKLTLKNEKAFGTLPGLPPHIRGIDVDESSLSSSHYSYNTTASDIRATNNVSRNPNDYSRL